MADEKSEQPDVLEKVARTVGSALGTVVSAAEELTGAKRNEAEGSPKNTARQKSIASAAQKAHDKKKAKRDKHKRKLGQKTRG